MWQTYLCCSRRFSVVVARLISIVADIYMIQLANAELPNTELLNAELLNAELSNAELLNAESYRMPNYWTPNIIERQKLTNAEYILTWP